MTNSKNLKVIETWINNVSIYPPAEIFFQAPKSQEKKEKRCKSICEELYRFNWEGSEYPNPIGSVRELVREMTILDRMFEYNPFPPKYENIVRMVAKFEVLAYHLYDMLESMHKQHPALSEFYKQWRVGLVQLHLNSLHWGADILRLPEESKDSSGVNNKYINDVQQAFKEMKK